MGNTKNKYYITQEYNDYCLSLINDKYFIEAMLNGREGAYGQLFYIEDLCKKYTFFSNLLYVASGLFIGIASWILLCSHGNVAALICCLIIYLGIFPSLIIASKLTKMNKLMVARTAFDNYGYTQVLRDRVTEDQRRATKAIKRELSSIEASINSLSKSISNEMPYLQRRELLSKFKDLHNLVTEYELLKDKYEVINYKYEQTLSHILKDYDFSSQIYEKMKKTTIWFQ